MNTEAMEHNFHKYGIIPSARTREKASICGSGFFTDICNRKIDDLIKERGSFYYTTGDPCILDARFCNPEETFSDYTEEARQNLDVMFEQLQAKPGVLNTGGTGNGKTCSANQLAFMMAVQDPGRHKILRYRWPKLLRLCSRASGIDREAQIEYDNVLDLDLLVIDDIISSASTDVRVEMIKELFDDVRKIVVTTN